MEPQKDGRSEQQISKVAAGGRRADCYRQSMANFPALRVSVLSNIANLTSIVQQVAGQHGVTVLLILTRKEPLITLSLRVRTNTLNNLNNLNNLKDQRGSRTTAQAHAHARGGVSCRRSLARQRLNPDHFSQVLSSKTIFPSPWTAAVCKSQKGFHVPYEKLSSKEIDKLETTNTFQRNPSRSKSQKGIHWPTDDLTIKGQEKDKKLSPEKIDTLEKINNNLQKSQIDSKLAQQKGTRSKLKSRLNCVIKRLKAAMNWIKSHPRRVIGTVGAVICGVVGLTAVIAGFTLTGMFPAVAVSITTIMLLLYLVAPASMCAGIVCGVIAFTDKLIVNKQTKNQSAAVTDSAGKVR